MAESWRDLVRITMEQDILRKRADPVVANFNRLVNNAMELGKTKAQEVRTEERTGRTAARTAVYGRYPQIAAREAGIDIPEDVGQITMPPGMEASKVTYDTSGVPTYTFEPSGLNEKDLATMYNATVDKIRSENARNAFGIQRGMVEEIEIPTFQDWKTDMYPEYAGLGTTQQTDEEFLAGLGIAEEHIEDYLSANPGLTREQLIQMLKDEVVQGE